LNGGFGKLGIRGILAIAKLKAKSKFFKKKFKKIVMLKKKKKLMENPHSESLTESESGYLSSGQTLEN
jgi:hypothetical protein